MGEGSVSGPWERYNKAAPAPAAQAPWMKYAAPRKDQLMGLGKGFIEPIETVAARAESGLKTVGIPIDNLDHAVGSPTAQEHLDSINQEVATKRAHGVVPGTLGEIAGNLIATAPIKGGAALSGALQGAALSKEKSLGGVAKDALIGAAGGKVGSKVIGAVSRVIAPKAAPHVQKLAAMGVQMTPGQIMGGLAKHVEDASTHVPALGDWINGARQRSLHDFNLATINHALSNIGQKLPKGIAAGHEAVSHAGEVVSKAYDEILPKLRVKTDSRFAVAVRNLHGMAQGMGNAEREQFNHILQNEVLARFNSSTGTMTGHALKRVEEFLGKKSAGLKSSAVYGERELGGAVQELQSQIRKMVTRSNPQHAAALNAVNSAYADLQRVEIAAAKTGAKGGVFTPAHFGQAVRQADTSMRKKAVARGTARMKDVANAAEAVLPNKVSDSGTGGRVAVNHLAAGGLGLGAHAVAPIVTVPGIVAASALAGAYSKRGGGIIQKALLNRPAGAQAAANAFAQFAKPAARLGTVTAVGAANSRP